MRKYYVTFMTTNSNDICSDTIELEEGMKADYETIYNKIDAGLNHYNGFWCERIIAWSLIEE